MIFITYLIDWDHGFPTGEYCKMTGIDFICPAGRKNKSNCQMSSF